MFRDRCHQERGAEHIFVGNICDFGIVWEIHKECTHERRARLVASVTKRVDVRHKPITQAQICLEDGLGLFAVGPDFVVRSFPVGAHYRLESAPLEPAHKQFGVILVIVDVLPRIRGVYQWFVGRMVVGGDIRREETGDVRIPIGHAAGSKVQSGGDRTFQHIPGRVDIARPEDGTVALRAKVCRSSQNHHPAAVSKVAPEPLVNRSCVKQGINVVITFPGPDEEEVFGRIDVWLGLIKP